MTQEEKIKDLEERIAIMDANDSALCADLEHWKKVAAGLKGHNKRLTEKMKKWIAFAKEAAEMNEKKAEQIANINALVDEKDRVIAGLQSQIAELNNRIANNEKNIKELTGERDVAIANYDYVCGLPWYQKMFFKGK